MNPAGPLTNDSSPPLMMAPERPSVPFYCQQQTSNQFRFYISDDIEAPDKYHQMCQVLRQATENDRIYIHLNSGGGQIDSTVQLMGAMRECKGEVVTVADGIVASAATLLFLAGDGFIVNPHCLFMVHNFSGGAYGKGHELESQINADVRWFTRMANDFYEGFLTKAEIKKVFKGEDFWFTADEVMARIGKRVAHLRQRDSESQQVDRTSTLSSIGNHLKPYLNETQAKQLDRLTKCAMKNLEEQQQGNATG